MAKSAPELILEILRSAGQPVTLASLGKQCAVQGVKYATTSKAAQELTKRREIVQVKRGVYALSEVADVQQAAAPAPSAMSASLGLPCASPSQGMREKTRAELLAVFDAGVAYCMNDLLEQLPPGWDRALVARFLREAIACDEITSRYDDEAKANVYALADDEHVDVAAAPIADAAPLSPTEPARRAVVPFGLIERLAAIGTDIEDALGDACDARLGHDLIKHLVVANGAIARSARLLGA